MASCVAKAFTLTGYGYEWKSACITILHCSGICGSTFSSKYHARPGSIKVRRSHCMLSASAEGIYFFLNYSCISNSNVTHVSVLFNLHTPLC